jgi:hypothetical protein
MHDAVVADVIFLAIMVAFFAGSVVFVKACEIIVGPDTEAERVEGSAEPGEQAAA